VRLRSKLAQPHNFTFSYNGATKLLSDVPGGGPFIYYDDRYAVGVRANAVTLRDLLAANPALFTENLARDRSRDAGAVLDDDENVYAAYLQYQGAWGPWNVLVGARLEKTDATYRGVSQVFGIGGSRATDVFQDEAQHAGLHRPIPGQPACRRLLRRQEPVGHAPAVL
jgi:hypothetical protein